MKILIFGLPGSGKTTFAKQLRKNLNVAYFNGDEVRTMFNDWDFSKKARLVQAIRMQKLCEIAGEKDCVIDFICPCSTFRTYYDVTVWMNTISHSQHEDTNKLFEKPVKVDYEVKNFNYKKILKEITSRF